MRSLSASLATASLLLLSASPLSAQATRIACKDGSTPKVGHFTCWGHGGVVSVPVKHARAAEKNAAATATKPAIRKPAVKAATRKKPVAKVHTSRVAKVSTK